MKVRFNLNYFVMTTCLFLAEVGIALFCHDEWIRPFFGDFLVVIMLYCGLRSFCNIGTGAAVGFVFVFSYTIEILQYFNYVEVLGLQNNKIAAVVLGTYFSWADLLMYTLGLVAVLFTEKLTEKKTNAHG